jgi:hypothetical protein
MSKTQEKKEQNIAAAAEFLKERRHMQMSVFKSNFDAGVQIYLANKENMSPEEIDIVEKEMAGAQELMDKLTVEWGL